MNEADPVADRVLVLGGGLAGVACAQKLGDEGIDVVLVDRNDYHQFQPLLYQVASSQLPAEDIARPHRVIFADYPSVTLVTAQVSAVKLSSSVPRRIAWGDDDHDVRTSRSTGRNQPIPRQRHETATLDE
jgi:NADPH-dependent 2,4-dienoyl-CoA reductase/sulfur reductase-like enzyme